MEAAVSETRLIRGLLGLPVCEGVSCKGQSSQLVNCAVYSLTEDELSRVEGCRPERGAMCSGFRGQSLPALWSP